MGQINHKPRIAPGRAIGNPAGLKQNDFICRVQLLEPRQCRQASKAAANHQPIGGLLAFQPLGRCGGRQKIRPSGRAGIYGQARDFHGQYSWFSASAAGISRSRRAI